MTETIPERLQSQLNAFLADLSVTVKRAQVYDGDYPSMDLNVPAPSETTDRWAEVVRIARHAVATYDALTCAAWFDPDKPDPFVLFGVDETDPASRS